MIENTHILLIDDDESSSHNLRTILTFLGESVMSTPSTQWAEQVVEAGLKNVQFSAAIVANCNGKSLSAILA